MKQIHGGDIYRNPGVTDFSVNSNPLGMPQAAADCLQRHMKEMEHYPDIWCEKLREAIAGFERRKADEILCGNGAAELFFAAALAVRPAKVLLPVPSFAEYERALAVTGAKICYYPLEERQEFRITEDFLDALTEEIDLVILCSPNNPTGQPVQRGLLEQILDKCRSLKIRLMLDECFVDFLDEPEDYRMTDRLSDYPELLVVKAFTKTFCMPGLRLGYALCSDRRLLERMRSCLQPWNVSTPAQLAGAAALGEAEQYLERTRILVKQEREKLMEALRKAGFQVYGSRANYIFFRGEAGFYEKALEAGFLIRDCGNYRGLEEGYYRIAVRTEDENARWMQWLRRS